MLSDDKYTSDGAVVVSGAENFHRPQNPPCLISTIHSLQSPSEVVLDADEEFPSPEVPMKSVDQNRNHLALPALTSLAAPMALQAATSIPSANYGGADCISCTDGSSSSGGASQVTSAVSTTLFARVRIRNESRGWSIPGPRKNLLSHLGNDLGGGSSGNTPDEERMW